MQPHRIITIGGFSTGSPVEKAVETVENYFVLNMYILYNL